ncbi:MAG TPA: efflux RND transporter periplasmic adaptor subunit [Methylomirabilota bacterium]|jgi:cobalt-zinc-cadmium efflux system membrane fusion protein|nr:efflux RND transporter periplasmic adaptor subunit [Methylomirabilota bacterium]
MKRTTQHVLLLAAALFASACAFSGCSSGPGESESKMTSYSGTESGGDTASLFTVPQDQMSHVKIVVAEKVQLPRVLRLTGSVAYNAFKTTPVFSAVGGPVQEILAAPGEAVRAGQPLLTVHSPDYSAARSAYIKARDAFALADKFYLRAQDLYNHGAIAEADLQQAESTRSQAHADLQSSEDALRALGLTDPEAVVKNPPKATLQIPVPAPVAGEVVERLVGPGQLLQAGATQVFTISDTSSVWVLVNVYQSDVAFVHVGDSVDVTTETYPEVFHGRISYIAPALDPSTRTLQARIVTANPGRRLKKDMYVAAIVRAGVVRGAVTVPDAAVLRDTENQPFVYVQAGSNQFARRLVKIGEIAEGRTQVTEGLKEGEHVVGDGALFLQFKNSLQR